MVFTDDEYNALNKIATATKMDCWFSIEPDPSLHGEDAIYDLENEEFLDVSTGLSELAEGVILPINDSFYNLTNDEAEAFVELCGRYSVVYEHA